MHPARRNSVHTWWTGLVSVSLYGVLFFRTRLHPQVQQYIDGATVVRGPLDARVDAVCRLLDVL